MFSTVITASKAAAPFAGKVVVQGVKAVTAAAIAYKANTYGRDQIGELVENLTYARLAVQDEVNKQDIGFQPKEQKSA